MAEVPFDPVPPYEPPSVYRIAGIGLALVGVAAALGAVLDPSGPSAVSSVRLLLVAAGTLAGGAAISMRPGLPLAWLLGSVTALLAWPGLPEHWDSIRMFARVVATVALAGGVVAAAPPAVRCFAASAAIVFHFFGIFLATTWPDPAPWFTQQVGTRVYLPYIQFIYMKNAYHFYSPEPGSASHLFCLVVFDKTDPATGKPEAKWVTMPSRLYDWKDPMGLAYYRRLSLTEQASGSATNVNLQGDELREIGLRRDAVANGSQPDVPRVPYSPQDTPASQFRLPRLDITRYLLPSYAAHLMFTNTTADKKVTAVKIYRLEHPIPSLFLFSQEKLRPHSPLGFKPYYLGEFVPTPEGNAVLRDKQDPMLYWLTPILPKKPDDRGRDYEDFMSKHAKYEFNWEARMP